MACYHIRQHINAASYIFPYTVSLAIYLAVTFAVAITVAFFIAIACFSRKLSCHPLPGCMEEELSGT